MVSRCVYQWAIPHPAPSAADQLVQLRGLVGALSTDMLSMRRQVLEQAQLLALVQAHMQAMQMTWQQGQWPLAGAATQQQVWMSNTFSYGGMAGAMHPGIGAYPPDVQPAYPVQPMYSAQPSPGPLGMPAGPWPVGQSPWAGRHPSWSGPGQAGMPDTGSASADAQPDIVVQANSSGSQSSSTARPSINTATGTATDTGTGTESEGDEASAVSSKAGSGSDYDDESTVQAESSMQRSAPASSSQSARMAQKRTPRRLPGLLMHWYRSAPSRRPAPKPASGSAAEPSAMQAGLDTSSTGMAAGELSPAQAASAGMAASLASAQGTTPVVMGDVGAPVVSATAAAGAGAVFNSAANTPVLGPDANTLASSTLTAGPGTAAVVSPGDAVRDSASVASQGAMHTSALLLQQQTQLDAAAPAVAHALGKPASSAVQKLDAPAPIAVICGVARGTKQAAIGAFDLVLYRNATAGAAPGSSRAATLQPACVLLQRRMIDGQWADTEPRVLTPVEFMAAAGLKGRDWKKAIRLYAGTVVGQPLALLLGEL